LKAAAEVCAHEVEDSAERAWEILRSTLVEAHVRLSPGLSGDLKGAFDDFYWRYCGNPEAILNSTRLVAGGSIDAAALESFQSRNAGARQVIWAKIDLFVRSLKQPNEMDKAAKTLVFISHAAADGSIGLLLKDEIKSRLPGLTVFCSSDPSDLPPGTKWSLEIQRALENSGLLLLVATRRGLQRQWVWFECGTFWFLQRGIIPLCLGDIRKGSLPAPLSELQAANADDPADLLTILALIARESGITLSDSKNLGELAKKLATLDAKASSESLADSGWLGAP
jgi:hypothetical protein